MTITKAQLTNPKIAALIDAKDRKALGVQTAQEASAKAEAGEERELQRQIAQYLGMNGAYFHQAPFGVKVKQRPGRADFLVCFRGRWLSLECKTRTGKQSPDQLRDQAEVERAGGIYRVVRSVADVVEIFKTIK